MKKNTTTDEILTRIRNGEKIYFERRDLQGNPMRVYKVIPARQGYTVYTYELSNGKPGIGKIERFNGLRQLANYVKNISPAPSYISSYV